VDATTGVVREKNSNEHAAHVRILPLRFTRLTWPLRDLGVFTRISLPLEQPNAHGVHVTYPYAHSFASSTGMHSHEHGIYVFLHQLQQQADFDRERREEAFENELEYTRPQPISVPDDILGRGNKALQIADRLTPRTALSAWRWKLLLIQTSLLSALNGICQELREIKYEPHYVDSVNFAGLEAKGTFEDSLICQNFEFVNQQRLEPKYRRKRPNYEVISRQFIQIDTGHVAIPGQYVELLDCTYGAMGLYEHKIRKPLWLTTSTDNRCYFVQRNDKHTSPLDLMLNMFRMQGSVHTVGNNDWYEID